jgi:ATP-binding cassette, subfamily B, bacterial PglK
MLKNLWKHLSNRRQKQFTLLLLLMLSASIAEVISIGAVLPFLGVLVAPEHLYNHVLVQPILQWLEIKSPDQLLFPFVTLFIVATIMSATIRLSLLYVITRLSFAAGADLSINIYQRSLYQEYQVHIARNSSEVINGIITKTNTVIGHILVPILTLISSVFFIIAIITTLFVIDPIVALIATFGFSILYWLVVRFTKVRLQENSQCIADQSTQLVKSLQEGLGGIRDVLIDGSQQFYCQLYRNADFPLRRASGNNQFISQSPRFIMEALGMVLITGIAYSMSLREDGLTNAIPVLGALALGAQRLLPALQQAYGSFSTIKGADSSFSDILDLLDQSLPDYASQPPPKPIAFNKDISLTNLRFRYNKKTPRILDGGINLTIPKGARIGFIGKTGSGKSTLLDIIMGLLPPSEGQISIDNQPITLKNRRAWQAHIAHVPQNIYLSDSSIAQNIAFGVESDKIDYKKVQKAAERAQISQMIGNWKDGYQTFVGERGVRLSGGQRQRIGIARALYKQADVLIFDEATSALDTQTEKAVMNAINDMHKDITILTVAHRLSTLENCDLIVELENGSINRQGAPEEIIDLYE